MSSRSRTSTPSCDEATERIGRSGGDGSPTNDKDSRGAVAEHGQSRRSSGSKAPSISSSNMDRDLSSDIAVEKSFVLAPTMISIPQKSPPSQTTNQNDGKVNEESRREASHDENKKGSLEETRQEREEWTPHRDQPRPSPVFVDRSWPQHSPVGTPPDQNGVEHRGTTLGDGASTSSTTTTISHSHRHQGQFEVPYNLMTQSFDSFSADGGGVLGMDGDFGNGLDRANVHEQKREDAPMGTDDDKPLPLNYRHTRSDQKHQNDTTYPSSSDEEKLDKRLSPIALNDALEGLHHSPLQRVIHLDTSATDGDGGDFGGVGSGDISPIALEVDDSRYSHMAPTESQDDKDKQREVLRLEYDSSSNSYHGPSPLQLGHPSQSVMLPDPGGPIGPMSTRTNRTRRIQRHSIRLQGTPIVTNDRDSVHRARASYHPDGLPPPSRRSIQTSPHGSGQQYESPALPPPWMESYPYQDHPQFQLSQQNHHYRHQSHRQPYSQPHSLAREPTSGNHYSPMTGGEYYHSNPFFVLRCFRKGFDGCSYLLSCLQDHPVCPVNVSAYGCNVDYEDQQTVDLDPEDLKVATCRIQSTICALGGYILRKANAVPMDSTELPNSHSQDVEDNSSTHRSIFRRPQSHRHAQFEDQNGPVQTRSQELYIHRFHQRYFIGGDGVSWEVEESPPVVIPSEEMAMATTATNKLDEGVCRQVNAGKTSSSQEEKEGNDHTRQNSSSDEGNSDDMTLNEHQQKMKYRCKLCGQPKQNHICPYQQSLQRSIAIMVDPTVHAYVSAEPGVLTPSLSDMNNFVAYGDSFGNSVDAFDAEGATRDEQDRPHPPISQVTPECNKGGLQNSPEISTMSSVSPGPSRKAHNPNTIDQNGSRTGSRKHHIEVDGGHGDVAHVQGPIPNALILRPEHFRAVTPLRTSKGKGDVVSTSPPDHTGDFQYPHVPLTFRGRKRLSDTLFYLSKDIPYVTADVTSLLRIAREEDEWDLAVAEILTQVVVGLFCSERDHRLDGLRSYLLNIGVSS